MSTWRLIQATWNEFGSYEWILAVLPALVFVPIAIGMKVMGKRATLNIRVLLLLICFPLSIISFVVHSESSTFFFLNNAARHALQTGVTLAHRDYCHPTGPVDTETHQALEKRLRSPDLLWLSLNSPRELKPLGKEATVPCDMTPVVRAEFVVVGSESPATYMAIARFTVYCFMIMQAIEIMLASSLAWTLWVSRNHRPRVAESLL